MPKFVVKDGVVEINGVDLAEHVRSVNVKQPKAKVDSTGLNAGGATQYTHGLADEEFEFEIACDFDPGSVDETLQPLYDNESEFTVRVRPFAGPAADDNPEYSSDRCKLFNYDPISGRVGELSTTTVTISSNQKITRTT